MTEPREEALPLTPDMLVARPQPGPVDFERVLGVWAAWQVLTAFLNPLVDNFAHLGGLAAGACTALACRPRLLARSAPR